MQVIRNKKVFLISLLVLALGLLASGRLEAAVRPDTTWYNPDRTAYELTTAYELAGLAQLVNSGIISSPNVAIQLGKDVNLTAVGYGPGAAEWTPIGNEAHPFQGEFSGKGYTISGLYINKPDEDFQGLFGVVGESAKIFNVGIVDVDVTGRSNVGALAGSFGGDIAEYCFATGKVTGSEDCIGGLIGTVTGSISACYAYCEVSGGDKVGGLVGNLGVADGFARVGVSYAAGNVSGFTNVGGLVGFTSRLTGDGEFWKRVVQSYAVGSVTGTGGGNVGGLIGGNNGPVSDSWSAGRVTGSVRVGALIGQNIAPGTVSESFFDSQGAGLSAGVGAGAISGQNVTGRDTQNITAGNNGYYPQIDGLTQGPSERSASQLSAVPVFLSGADTSKHVTANFSIPANTADGTPINWTTSPQSGRLELGDAVDGSISVKILSAGDAELTASVPDPRPGREAVRYEKTFALTLVPGKVVAVNLLQVSDLREVVDSDGENVQSVTSIADVTFNKGAIEDLITQAEAFDAAWVEIVFERKETLEDESLTDEQKAELSDDRYRHIYDISVHINGKKRHFETTNGGKLTIGLPYQLNTGERHENIWPVYVDEEGKPTRIEEGREHRENTVFFNTDHLSSIYAVTYELEDVDVSRGGGSGCDAGVSVTSLAFLGALALWAGKKGKKRV